MTDVVQPEWLQGYTPNTEPPKGNPQWTKGMKSPNPAGRPRGVSDRRAKLANRMLDDAQGIIDKMIAQALEGDPQCAHIILSRVMPALRAQSEKVEFDFDASSSVTEQAEAVLQAIADGKVAPDVGKQILEGISTLYGIKQVAELEARLQALEEKA
jgi:hypothetical protein